MVPLLKILADGTGNTPQKKLIKKKTKRDLYIKSKVTGQFKSQDSSSKGILITRNQSSLKEQFFFTVCDADPGKQEKDHEVIRPCHNYFLKSRTEGSPFACLC